MHIKNPCPAEIKIMRVGEPMPLVMVNNPKEIRDSWDRYVVSAAWYEDSREHLVVFPVNTRLRLLGVRLLSIGTINETVAHPRDVLRPAILLNAYGFVLAHNHPSGEVDPSRSDLNFTLQLREAAKIMQIEFLDHLIIPTPCAIENSSEYYSFKEAGYL